MTDNEIEFINKLTKQLFPYEVEVAASSLDRIGEVAEMLKAHYGDMWVDWMADIPRFHANNKVSLLVHFRQVSEAVRFKLSVDP